MSRRLRPLALAAAATAALLALAGCQISPFSPSKSDKSDTSSRNTDLPTDTEATDTEATETEATDTEATDTEATDSTSQKTPTKTGTEANMGSVKDAGDIPDVCTLLTPAQVTTLTARAITQIDADGGTTGDPSRYCQWQLEGGQLAVFLSRTTTSEFGVKVADAETVDGVGEDAYLLSGHLFVLYGTVQVDVYARGGEDPENLAVAKRVVDVLLPKI